MSKLFIYGTLHLPDVQSKVFGRTVNVKEDILHDYIKGSVVINNKVYPMATRSNGKHIKGGVIEVTKEELNSIDHYETKAYKRTRLKLNSGIYAWVYVRP